MVRNETLKKVMHAQGEPVPENTGSSRFSRSLRIIANAIQANLSFTVENEALTEHGA